VFLDELKEGVLVHTKSVLPHETLQRNAFCKLKSRISCPIGFVCPETTPFEDALHTKNMFQDAGGNYCNCWINEHLEHVLIPRLEDALRDIG
jgi:hypothetical protein